MLHNLHLYLLRNTMYASQLYLLHNTMYVIAYLLAAANKPLFQYKLFVWVLVSLLIRSIVKLKQTMEMGAKHCWPVGIVMVTGHMTTSPAI